MEMEEEQTKDGGTNRSETKCSNELKESQPQKESKEVVKATFVAERVITEDSNAARELYNQSRYGIVLDNGKVQLSLPEALYLLEKGKLVIHLKKKKVKVEEFIKKAKRYDKQFWVRYCVFKDLRTRGYIVKTALKFGADFRVYDRGVKPGEDHARWIVYPVHESNSLTWQEFAAKNRVAHSTRKKLLLAVVDEEGEVSYWESRWLRP